MIRRYKRLVMVIKTVMSLCTLESAITVADELISIVPQPMNIKKVGSHFILNKNSKIVAKPKSINVADYLARKLRTVTGFPLPIITDNKKQINKNIIIFAIDKTASDDKEGYKLNVKSDYVKITAPTQTGLFYGTQSLLQLFPAEVVTDKLQTKIKWQIPGVQINDKPRFKWRGLHLDVGRHFFTVQEVKQFLDTMALYKYNTFHWHLTEDQGWRIEIKKYPKLTQIGSIRKSSPIPEHREKADNKTYSGFYTQNEIREVVAYAKKLHITIVPEIEMPGHSQAAVAAYPWLGNTNNKVEVRTTWGVSMYTYNLEERTFQFLQDVLDEVMELFPSKYIHIGGDEAPKQQWLNSKNAMAKMKKEGLKNAHELQSYFIKRIENYLNAHGRYLIGWDEILEGGLAPNAAVMSWRSEEGGTIAANSRHYAVMTPGEYCYFDLYQALDNKYEPPAMGGCVTLEKVYSYNPIPKAVKKENEKFILGAQGNLWTEFIPNFKQLQYQAFPRALALAEVVWSNQNKKNWKQFKKRMIKQYKRLELLQINYRLDSPEPEFNSFLFKKLAIIKFINIPKDMVIHYTTDGTKPTKQSAIYNNPIKIDKSCLIKAIYQKDNGRISSPTTVRCVKQKFTVPTDLTNGWICHYAKGTFSKVPDFSTLKNVKKTVVKTYDINHASTKDLFTLGYFGWIKIPKDGIYCFSTASDDGSIMTLAGGIIIDNDGLHSYNEEKIKIALKAGYYPIHIGYIERGGGERLDVFMQGPNMPKQTLPEKLLFHSAKQNP